MRAPAPIHYLRPNDTVWTPPAVIFADTETRTITEPGRDVETLRLWVAHYLDRRTRDRVAARDEWAAGDQADELAAWVTNVTRNRETVWLFTHNLSFDLAATRLPMELVANGWVINDAAVGGRAPWLRLGRGKRVLTVVDSASWLPRPVEELGHLVGIRKLRLPRDDAPDTLWEERCRHDVLIIERAMLSILDWWDANELGRFNITGPACGWNAFRHKMPTREVQPAGPRPDGRPGRVRKVALEPITVDPTPEYQEQDRRCHHGGRRGTWRIGDHRAGPFTELDFVSAYPMVAAELPLPNGRAARFTSLELDDKRIGSQRWGITARVRVHTETPRWPLRIGGATWYPVGEFWTHLAGPEIAQARELGCLLEIGQGWVHRLGHSMAPWAQWVLDVQNGHDPSAPKVAEIMAKGWGRSVIGKWASRGYEKIKLGPSPGAGWGYEEGWDHTGNVHGGTVDLAGQRWWVAATGEADNAYPAIPAWVESEVRVRLNRVLEALGSGAVLQCDTDGLIVVERTVGTPAARGSLVAPASLPAAGRLGWCLEQLAPLVAPLVLRPKRRLNHVHVLGPQHVTRNGERKYAGLPALAVPAKVCGQCGADPAEQCGCDAELVDSATRFTAKLWPKLQWQLAHGDSRGYVRPEVRPEIKGPWPTGWLLADKTVVPVEAYVGRDGTTRLVEWNGSRYARAGARLAPAQHPRLAGHY